MLLLKGLLIEHIQQDQILSLFTDGVVRRFSIESVVESSENENATSMRYLLSVTWAYHQNNTANSFTGAFSQRQFQPLSADLFCFSTPCRNPLCTASFME
jgi:hypothetical protein